MVVMSKVMWVIKLVITFQYFIKRKVGQGRGWGTALEVNVNVHTISFRFYSKETVCQPVLIFMQFNPSDYPFLEENKIL